MEMLLTGTLCGIAKDSKIFVDFDNKFVHVITHDRKGEQLIRVFKEAKYERFVEKFEACSDFKLFHDKSYHEFVADNFVELI